MKEKPDAKPLSRAPREAPTEFRRIRLDTYIGMAFSNLVAVFIIITCAATLHAKGITDIQSSAEAAEALRPIAGPAVFVIFALGIVGTGMLAVPVLAGSAAYAVGEAFGWHVGLSRRLKRAKAFYAVIALAMLIGAGLNFTRIDPIKALFWSAVLNGVVAAPVMAMMMLMGAKREVMGEFTLSRTLRIMGWLGTALMTVATLAMFATWSQ